MSMTLAFPTDGRPALSQDDHRICKYCSEPVFFKRPVEGSNRWVHVANEAMFCHVETSADLDRGYAALAEAQDEEDVAFHEGQRHRPRGSDDD